MNAGSGSSGGSEKLIPFAAAGQRPNGLRWTSHDHGVEALDHRGDARVVVLSPLFTSIEPAQQFAPFLQGAVRAHQKIGIGVMDGRSEANNADAVSTQHGDDLFPERSIEVVPGSRNELVGSNL